MTPPQSFLHSKKRKQKKKRKSLKAETIKRLSARSQCFGRADLFFYTNFINIANLIWTKLTDGVMMLIRCAIFVSMFTSYCSYTYLHLNHLNLNQFYQQDQGYSGCYWLDKKG